ncbi:hypothetical protein QCA50_001102 [Cerrena zonata]|uniref:F-box domain-containing protein n=1 Tax=Cerrena zonata TaxID=2478898 RepID=A0AAW0H0G1_9APHY
MSMVSQHNQSESRFLSLPSELIENTLVCTSSLGFPEAIAAVAQTCRDMRALIYGAPDQHLWREIYLAVFDDPRPGLQIDRQDLGPNPSLPPSSSDDIDFEWGAEFRQRVWAANYFARSTGPSANISPSLYNSFKTMTSDLDALEALLSVVHTAEPFPPDIIRIPVALNSNADAYISSKSYPIFPPLPTAYNSPDGPSGQSSSTSSTYRPSRNIEWLQSTIANGLPPSLNIRLSGLDQSGGSQALWQSQIESKMMRALGKLTAITGFRPIIHDNGGITSTPVPNPETTATAEAQDQEDNSDDADDDQDNGDGDTESPESAVDEPETREEGVQTDSNLTLPIDMSVAAQETRARRLARMRVYNMHYLDVERHWGPFLLPSTAEPDMAALDDRLGPLVALLVNAGHPNDDNHTLPVAAPNLTPPPSPDRLRADWAYLGAVRVVVETNLLESVGTDGLSGLLSLEGLRRGSAPMGLHDDDPLLPPIPVPANGKGKQKDPEEVTGWDWAGVDGIWRRCVCWMDYRDLILHNLSNGFNDPTLQEAVRIVPMRLRVSHYTPAKIPQFPHRPTIHLEGETAGPAGTSGIRRIRGTVQMISDGSIRWTLYSSALENGPDEWVTEGIQVGEVTSVMGILGMWTGAQHAHMDPLGPFWAWKVN